MISKDRFNQCLEKLIKLNDDLNNMQSMLDDEIKEDGSQKVEADNEEKDLEFLSRSFW